jgi:hypothetical protein
MKKYTLMLLLAALILAIVPVVSAQDTLGASQEDYDLWTTANANTAEVETLTYGFTATVTATGMGNSNVDANISGSGVLDTNADAPQFQLDVTGTVVQGEETTPVNASIRLVDDTIYANQNDEGWKGQPAEDFLGQLSGFGLPVDPSSLGSGDVSELSQNPMLGDIMSGLGDVQPSEFLTLTSADQNGLKELTLTVDVAKLVASPAVAPLFGAMMGGMGGGQEMTAAQLQQMQGMMAGMLGTAEISLSEVIDPATQLVQQVTFNCNIPLDAIIGPGAAVAINFQLNLSNFDQPVTVEAPADAVMEGASGG